MNYLTWHNDRVTDRQVFTSEVKSKIITLKIPPSIHSFLNIDLPSFSISEPTPPIECEANRDTASRLVVTWSIPENTHGKVLQYTIYYQPKNMGIGGSGDAEWQSIIQTDPQTTTVCVKLWICREIIPKLCQNCVLSPNYGNIMTGSFINWIINNLENMIAFLISKNTPNYPGHHIIGIVEWS